MCGVGGILAVGANARAPLAPELWSMAAALVHRGPDQRGVAVLGPAGLAHSRLSIIDLVHGRQPMTTEGRRYWLSYNGEVFNYRELRKELEETGVVFTEASDTEVVLRAYEAWGHRAFSRFIGQFALAIWDVLKKELVLARDRFGVRPLHTCLHDGRLYFASEIKAIFAADRNIRRELDPAGLDEVFTFWAPVAPRTAFAGVREVRPGHVETYSLDGRVRDESFCEQDAMACPGGFRGSLEDASALMLEQLRTATDARVLCADVPLGAYLSGGLDSSLIVALARSAVSGPLSTFSIRFEEAEFDEGGFQKLVADGLGTDHHELVVSSRDIADVFPKVIHHAEKPILRTAPAPLFLLSRFVREAGIKVVLTGEGADEVFAGYDIFREAKVRRFWARHPGSRTRPRLLERLYPWLERSPMGRPAMAAQFFGRNLERAAEADFAHDPRWHSTSALKRLLSRGMREASHDARGALFATLPSTFRQWSPLARDQYLEVRTLLSSYILSSQGDRMHMAHSVEGRFPFLDTRVVALADSLPPSFKLHVLDEKHILKRLARGHVPEAVLERKKQPYRAPDARAFLRKGAPPWIGEVLGERAIASAGVFEPALVRRLRDKCQTGHARLSNADDMALVGVLSTQLLHETVICHAALPARIEDAHLGRDHGTTELYS